jgi:NAD(P)-dependent dehydrogenase (short-subunit alcohol dehydrogenase family)
MDLAGKGAVITGGASGIGLATARQLARRGADLVLADIEPGALAVARESLLGEADVRVETVICDVSRHDDVVRLADTAFDRLGGVHVLFNNAGVAVGGAIADMKHSDWKWIIDVDLWGVVHGVEAFLPRIIAQGQGGHILFTASFAGLVPNVGLGPYCVAKYGVVALAEVLYREVRPHDIGVSVLCPMRVATNIGDSERNRRDEYGGRAASPRVPEQAEDNRDMAGRVLDVDDVAGLVLDAIDNRELYILPHPESLEPIKRRFARIEKTLERQRLL